MLISAIICTRNRHDLLRQAITSIEDQDLDRDDYELIVIDNSTPGTERDEVFGAITFACNGQYVLEDAPGLSRARNLGLEYSSGRYVAFLDDDAEAGPGWLAAAVAAFERADRAGVVGGPVEPIWAAERPGWLHQHHEGFLTIVERGDVPRAVGHDEWLAGTNIAFLRSALRDAGGFDTTVGRVGNLLLSNEELLTTQRIRANGFEVFYEPAMRVRHRVHLDRLSQSWLRRRAAWQAVSDILAAPSTAGAIEADLQTLRAFYAALPIRRQKFGAILQEQTRRDDFGRQMDAVGALARLMLLHGIGPD